MRAKLTRIAFLLWGLALLTLPVTSFRYFPFLGKSTFVRPLAFYPLVLLYLVQFVRLLRGETSLPWQPALLPLGVFVGLALLATVGGALLAPLPMRGQAYWARALRALLTLGIGLAFFLAALWMQRDLGDIRPTLKWLYAGLVLTLLWSGVQVIGFYTPLLAKKTVAAWQHTFSIRGLTKLRRVSGLSFEPSWLAGQLAVLYLPWLVGSVLMRFRLTKFRWLEPLLLVLTGIDLVLTYSRGGLLIALAAALVTITVAGRRSIASALRWLFRPQTGRPRLGLDWGLRIVILALVLGLIAGAAFFLSRQNYVNRLWTTSADSLPDYFIKTNAGGRFSYLWATTSVFLEHPWLGTGLGASGFYLYDHLPDWSLSNVPEITKQLSPGSKAYPNPKNMYLRLLAETGLVGMVLFWSFLFGMLAEIRDLFAMSAGRLAGAAGLFTWTGLVVYLMVQDSFAMAELWVNFGLILGLAAALPHKEMQEHSEI